MEPSDQPFPPDVYLEVLSGDRSGIIFPINAKTVTIGRDPNCDLQLPDPHISRKHCQIVFRGDHFTVVDLGSLNKTIVKGKPYIQKNLKHGNPLTLGKTQLRFLWEGAKQWLAEQGLEQDSQDRPAVEKPGEEEE